jgi:hypothetical protein
MKNVHLRRCPHPSSTMYLRDTPYAEGLHPGPKVGFSEDGRILKNNKE